MGSLAGKWLVRTCFLRLSLQMERKSLFPFTSIPSAPYSITETAKKAWPQLKTHRGENQFLVLYRGDVHGSPSIFHQKFHFRGGKKMMFNESLYNLHRVHAGAVDTNGLGLPRNLAKFKVSSLRPLPNPTDPCSSRLDVETSQAPHIPRSSESVRKISLHKYVP